MKILDFGCGRKKYPNSIGIDISHNSSVDIRCDLNKFFYPIKSNSFDFIWCHHSLEHVSDIFGTLKELHRIGKPGALMEIHVPHAMQSGAMAHLDHKRTFKLDTFDIFDPKYMKKDHSNEIYSDIIFEVAEKKLSYRNCGYSRTDKFKGRIWTRLLIKIIDKLSNKMSYSYERFWGYWVGGSEEVIFKLRIVK